MRKTTLLGTISLLASGWALGAEPEHLNVQPPARPPYLESKPAGEFSLPPVAPDGTEVAPGTQGALLERVRFTGNSVISMEALQAVAAPYLGKRVGEADIETLRQKVTLLYVERGYVNSGALLAEGGLEGGTLTLQIVEGSLKEIRLRGLARLDGRYVASRLAKDGEPLNVHALGERFQLLLGDPLFARMNAQLLPDTERGKAILNIDIERATPYQLSLSANNYRPVSIGEQSATLGGWVRNLTGWGDVLEAGYQSPIGGGDATRTTLGWRIPLNTWGTHLSLNHDRGASSVIEQPAQTLDIQSKLVSKEIGLSQVLHETLRHRFSAGLSRVMRENSTTLLGAPFSFVPGEPTGTSRVRDWRFWQEYSYRRENQALALRSTFTQGENNQVDDNLPPGMTLNPRYRVWLGQAHYARKLHENGTQLILRFNIQDSPHRLIAMEGMSAGGIHSVRGYRENQLVRDNGMVTNIELDFPVANSSASKFAFNLIPFFDHGRAWNNGEERATLSSLGLAARLRWRSLILDLAMAKRQSHPASIPSGTSDLQDKGIHFQLTYNFFGESQ